VARALRTAAPQLSGQARSIHNTMHPVCTGVHMSCVETPELSPWKDLSRRELFPQVVRVMRELADFVNASPKVRPAICLNLNVISGALARKLGGLECKVHAPIPVKSSEPSFYLCLFDPRISSFSPTQRRASTLSSRAAAWDWEMSFICSTLATVQSRRWLRPKLRLQQAPSRVQEGPRWSWERSGSPSGGSPIQGPDAPHFSSIFSGLLWALSLII